MTFKELFQKLDVDSNALGKGLPPEFNLAGDVSEDVLVKFIRFLLDTAMVLKTERKWHTGTPTEEGDYIVWLRFCNCIKDKEGWLPFEWDKERGLLYNGKVPVSEFGEVLAWQKIEPYEETD